MLDVQSFVSLATASLPCRQTVVASVVSAVALRIDDPVYTTCYTRDYKGDNGRASTSRLSHEYTYHVLSATPYLQVRAFVGDIRSMYRIIMDQQTPDVQRLMEGVRLVTSPPELLMISNASEIPLVDGPAETEDAEWEKYGDVCLGDRCYLHNHLEGSEFSFKVCAKTSCLRQIRHRRRPSICKVREQLRLFKVFCHNPPQVLETSENEPCGNAIVQRTLVAEVAAGETPAVIDVLPEPDSPVAAIDPAEAAKVCEQQWATNVEFRVSGAALATPARNYLRVVALVFNRDQHAFDDVLLNSELAFRARASGCSLQPPWAKGAKIFVPEITEEHMEEARVVLQPRHVVTYEEDVPEILSALEALPSHLRPRLKPTNGKIDVPLDGALSMLGELSASPSDSSMFGELTAGSCSSPVKQQLLQVKWTFIHVENSDAADKPQRSKSV